MTPEQAVDRMTTLYEASAGRLRKALEAFIANGETPTAEERAQGAFAYPELRLTYHPDGPPPPVSRSFPKPADARAHAASITQPVFFRDYLLGQLNHLVADYPVRLDVGLSRSEIPYPYVLDNASGIDAEALPPAEFARWFPTPSLAVIGDE